MSATEPIQIHCNSCGKEQRHTLEKDFETKWDAGDDTVGYVNGADRYHILTCGGCGSVTFRHLSYFSESPEEGWVATYFPPRFSRQIPDWVSELDSDLSAVMQETYSALSNGQNFLAAFGARTCMDIVMTGLVGDVGSFENKVKAMTAAGHITPKEEALWDVIIETGSAAAHRGYQPTTSMLAGLAEMVEVLVHRHVAYPKRVIELEKEALKIKGKVPPRPPRITTKASPPVGTTQLSPSVPRALPAQPSQSGPADPFGPN